MPEFVQDSRGVHGVTGRVVVGDANSPPRSAEIRPVSRFTLDDSARQPPFGAQLSAA